MPQSKIRYFKENVRFRLSRREELSKWITRAIRKEGFKTGEINIVFCSDRYLHDINKKFLGHDYKTDIVTFGTSDDPSVVGGELYISTERIQENAADYEVSFNDELHRVIIHGVLHLCNYSDKSALKQKEMRHAEDKYLSERSWMKKHD